MCSWITQRRKGRPCGRVGEGADPCTQPLPKHMTLLETGLASCILAEHQSLLRGWWECSTWGA